MKISISYPPLESEKGVPLLGQNRQFQYFHKPTYIYPMVPAYAASLLKEAGHEVFWQDGIAEKKTYAEWERELMEVSPDVVVFESKCPVIAKHWKLIDALKEKLPETIFVLVGDHVTAEPLESFSNSKVDVVIAGGDYDFLLLDLAEHLEKGTPLPPGFYVSGKAKKIKAENAEDLGGVLFTGKPRLDHDVNSLPFIDRELTKWRLYAFENGNFKFTPGTYVYSGRDCWWGKCTFCVWDNTINPCGSYRSFTPERLFAEVKHVIDTYHVKEIFDDAGSMFAGEKMKKFCRLLIESGYNEKAVFGCNMRFDGMDKEGYELMKRANFRFVLFGLESGNQTTLDRINKGITLEQIEKGAKECKEAGLQPHVTIMLGYPWESLEDAERTVAFAKKLFKLGYIDTLQATVCIPYPGTPLHRECKEKGWLLTENYEDYDMRRPVMKSPLDEKDIMRLTREVYRSFMSPAFVWRKIIAIRSFSDIKFLFTAGLRVLGHLTDFS